MPTEVSTPAELAAVTGSGNYLQVNDIDLDVDPYNTGSGWGPIVEFDGVYDGGGFAITGLFQDRTSEFGGVFGWVFGSSMTRVHVVGCNITNTSTRNGALMGRNNGSNVTQCSATGTINGGELSGGLVGHSTGTGTFARCFANVAVSGSANQHGGFCGGSDQAANSFTDCYAIGSVSGNDVVGGFVGGLRGAYTRCYSSGAVSGSTNVGGFSGSDAGSGSSVSGCFWDTETSGQGSSAHGTGKTTSEMQTLSTFTGASWGIVPLADYVDEVWKMPPGSYPILGWETAEAPPTNTRRRGSFFMGLQ